jgi:hypothetical protein
MKADSSRPKLNDLAFQVFSRTIHPEWLEVRTHHRLIHEGWDADVRVINGGHAIHWRFDSYRMTEILTCPDPSLPETGRLFQTPVRRERSKSLSLDGFVDYQTTMDIERCDAQVFDHLCNEATLDAKREGLYFAFSSKNRLMPAAISLIRYETRSNGLSIHSFHSFPQERVILRTHSLFESRLSLRAR